MDLGFIIKVSKLCNLRCTYCYEYPELANKSRMSIGDIRGMFLNIRRFIKRDCRGLGRVRLIWHGGEPFAQPVSYWKEILSLQKQIFGVRFQRQRIVNTIQSNLTLLKEKHLPLIKGDLHLGFSYDVINDFRVNVGGKSTDSIVRQKIDWLLKEGVHMGGIAVISKKNIDSPDRIASFFLDRNLDFRALHLYQSLDLLPQVREAAPPFDDYLNFLNKLYELPRVKEALKRDVAIEPLYNAYKMVKAWKKEERLQFSDEDAFTGEWAMGVNTNGDLFGAGVMYDPNYCYGNIFKDPLDKLLQSEGRRRRIELSRPRIEKVCKKCVFFRTGCNGIYVSHATPEDYREYERLGGCEYGLSGRMILKTEQRKKRRPRREHLGSIS